MSDLLSLLSLGSSGIAAQNTGVAVAANNVANVNTAGYSRQRVDLESLLAAPLVGGVRSGAPDRMQDNLLAGRVRVAAGSMTMSNALYEALLDVEGRVAGAGASVHENLGGMFSSISRAAATPTDSASRQAVVNAVRDLVEGIRRRAADLESARTEANTRIKDNSVQASALAQQLAQTNLAIAGGDDPVLRDQRDRIATQLTELTGGAARVDGDGQMRFVLDGGGVLVDGTRAASLSAAPDPTTGDTRVALVDGAVSRDVTTAIGGGKLAADITARDTTLSTAQRDLDQLAFDVTSQFNAVHAANAGLDGVSGRNLFVPPAGVAGAARTFAIDPDIAADPSKLALGAPGGGTGDNTGALAMFALAQAPNASGGRTFTDAALDMVTRVGTRTAEARSAVQRDTLVSENLAGLRDSLAGVDIQEELSNLARFEHATSAMTKFVSTIDGMLGDLIDRL
jgi:flagellar hook-associated protein 1